jgi:hypothetical protein
VAVWSSRAGGPRQAPRREARRAGHRRLQRRRPAGHGHARQPGPGQHRAVEVTFDRAQGTVRVEQAARVRLTTVDGDITAGRLGGDAQVRTAMGRIRNAR